MPTAFHQQQSYDYDAVDEWISNWQFERVAPTSVATTRDPNQDSFNHAFAVESTTESNDADDDDEDGIFYFERVLSDPPTITTSNDINDKSATAVDSSSVSVTPPSSFDIDMGNSNSDDEEEDFFAELEAAADQIDEDGEISLGDFMEEDTMDLVEHKYINVKNDRDLHQDQHDEKSDTTSITVPLFDDIEDDEDVDMLLSDTDDDYYGYQTTAAVAPSSPVASSGNLYSYDSSSSSRNSPTSVTNVMMQLPGMPSLSAKSEKTRPALFEMRKMMMAMNNNNSNSNGNKSNLPCAAGMDYLYLDTLRNLQKSMDRTKKSRKSLSIQTTGTEQYGRSLCVHQIVKSVQISSAQVDTCLQSVVGC